MPQKKNPDVAELARGKTGRVFGNLVALLTLLKGLPMTYNRDLQEDKERLFDTADTVRATTRLMAAMLQNTRINPSACAVAANDPALLATDLADYLVRKGVPFRDAHHIVGAALATIEKLGVKKRSDWGRILLKHIVDSKPKFFGMEKDARTLVEAKEKWKFLEKTFESDADEIFNLKAAMAKRNLTGAPGTKEVAKQLARWREQLS
jgi:argininosuccinate lyase